MSASRRSERWTISPPTPGRRAGEQALADIDRRTLVVSIQAVEIALAQQEGRTDGGGDPEWIAELQRARARLRASYEREREFDPNMLPWQVLAGAQARSGALVLECRLRLGPPGGSRTGSLEPAVPRQSLNASIFVRTEEHLPSGPSAFRPGVFPPALRVGCRVWTESGYLEHGPFDGPKQDIAGSQGGEVIATERPYSTMDQFLYTVRWDNGQMSKHYARELFSTGRFRTRKEFMAAFFLVDTIQMRVGPKGGFRSVKFRVLYDGEAIEAETRDRGEWTGLILPAAIRQGVEIMKTKA
jgi:hypothetical protein